MIYSKGYKYKLEGVAAEGLPLSLRPCLEGKKGSYYHVHKGILFVHEGYAWDGATGIPDLDCAMRPSLFHDVLYQMMREGILPRSHRFTVDHWFMGMLNLPGFIKDGGLELLTLRGEKSSMPDNRKIYTA